MASACRQKGSGGRGQMQELPAGKVHGFPSICPAQDRLRRVERIMLLFDQVISELR
jgi:hypothetical protein